MQALCRSALTHGDVNLLLIFNVKDIEKQLGN
jgi:hypothetical protein